MQERRRRSIRTVIVLFAIAAAFYIGFFIVMSIK